VLSEYLVDHVYIRVKIDGNSEASLVSIKEIDFRPHEFMRDDEGCKFQLRLRKSVLARDLEVKITNHENGDVHGKKGIIRSHVCSDTGSIDQAKHLSSRRVRVNVGTQGNQFDIRIGCLDLPPNVVCRDDQLFILPEEPVASVTIQTESIGRILQHHPLNNTVSVIFGCNTG
jgi:hypothetical protein